MSTSGTTLTRVPLAALHLVPGVAALLAVALLPEHAVLIAAVAVVAYMALGVALARQLRVVGRGPVVLSRDLARLHDRMAALQGRAGLLERLIESNAAGRGGSHVQAHVLLAELVQAEERTRAYLAAELHDTVAQTLAQSLLELRAGRATAGLDSVRDAEDQLRAVLARIRPPELAENDLADAVADLCRGLEQRYGVAVDVRWPDTSIVLPVHVATIVYRFAQEMLLNAAVHADGAGVRLEVTVDDQELVATVRDDGAGFDPSAVVSEAGRHVGLRLARERARSAGGSLDVTSVPGAGTTARLHLPIPGGAAAAS